MSCAKTCVACGGRGVIDPPKENPDYDEGTWECPLGLARQLKQIRKVIRDCDAAEINLLVGLGRIAAIVSEVS